MRNYQRSDGGILMPETGLAVRGFYRGQIVRKGEVIDEFECPNMVVNQGLNHVLDTEFHGTTQVSAWYIGIFEGNYTPVATVTAATITAQSTECTAYDEATRVAFDEGAASGQVISNEGSAAVFTFNAAKTIYGAFLVSASAKSATSGVLFSAARFTAAKTVADDDQLLLTYGITAAAA